MSELTLKKSTDVKKKALLLCTKEELVWFVSVIEEKYKVLSSSLVIAHSKLSRARLRIRAQKSHLNHLRKRIVELTVKRS